MLREANFVSDHAAALFQTFPSAAAAAAAPPPDAGALRAAALKAREKLALTAYALHVGTAFLCMAGLCVAIWAADEVFTARVMEPFTNPQGRSAAADALKGFSSVLTAAAVACAAAHHFCLWRLHPHCDGLVLRGGNALADALASARGRLALAQLALLLVHCPAGYYAVWRTKNTTGVMVDYDADSLLTLCMLLPRTWPTVELLLRYFSGFDTTRARVMQLRTGVRLSTQFATRYLLARRPFVTASLLYLCTVGLFSYAMKVCERPLCYIAWPTPEGANWCADATKSNNETWNAFWVVIITSLTVGYGDIFPYTHFGRCVAILCALVGICVIAMLVNAVTSFLKLDVREKFATDMIQSDALRAQRRALAAAVVARFLRFAARALRGSARHLHVKRLAAARFEWPPGAGREVAAGWVPWRFLSGAARAQLAGFPLNEVGRGLRAPLARALEDWRGHQAEWARSAWKRDTLEVVDERLQVLMVRAACIGLTGRARGAPPFAQPLPYARPPFNLPAPPPPHTHLRAS
jgi:hypothetical protein